ncbi:tocopherol O-methyltransferase [Marchantia polymorpha subsp. ruderalis]|uniref:Methyltransferase type 11 domain-containing protein n=1 Tax=Marchantia polymorpha TaxID=3197 RepID=A0A2R6XBA2_MARPO|nr:hypothetical protein MARPO_0025s0046 [Marchantia polymorpha]BBN03783.1 hypothetical protein Mp_2g26380 [Marchantia polymorpha subsp. ruderalis]|eukprot:PTQ43352.1 hypothetical protein MARPO_0025s0046 [Marchantia polymorpha]
MASAVSAGAMANLSLYSTGSCSSLVSSSSGRPLKITLQQKRRVYLRSAKNQVERRLSVVCSVGAKERTVPELNEGIANFYNESSGIWEEVWGEHMHHGYYDPNSKDAGDHKEAQIRMIEESLAWAGIPEDEENKPRTVVDVGCGIGGSARYLARKYNANVKAITLSPIQAQRGTAITADQGLSKSVNFQVADALKQPFSDGEFDLVWSMESGEHMPDKRKFVQELARVAAPDGRILIVTWCHRDLKPAELSLSPEELELLDKICDAYYLPAWCSPSDYVRIAESIGLKDVKSADWSEYVTPFWPAVMVSALSLKGLFGLAKAGWTTIKGALAMGLMVQGYQRGLIKFALITARKAS